MKMKGAIISGYQGIGKSTLSDKSARYLDLESSNFFVDGKRNDDWYKVYANIAINFAKQGYYVFISSHAVVREYLAELNKEHGVDMFVCYPDLSLKEVWLERLEKRYKETGLDKDYRSWQNAVDRFDDNIKELSEAEGFRKVPIKRVPYSLQYLLFYLI